MGAKGLVLVATITALVTVLWVNATNLTSLSIEYIKSPIYGDFIRTQGQVIPALQTHHTLNGANECDCRIACFSHPNCKSLSIEPLNGEVLCRLSWFGPPNSIIENTTNAVYIFRPKNSKLLGFEADRFLYWITNTYRQFDAAKEYCENTPGFRLGISQSVAQYNTLMKMQQQLSTHLWVDMEGTSEGPMWGNGILFQNTPAANIATPVNQFEGNETNYIATQNVLAQTNSSYWFLSVCQANPLGLDW